MGRNSSISARFFLFLSTPLMCFLCLAIAADTLLSNQSIKDGEVLLSANKRFQLRFFSPDGDTNHNRYVGIWFDAGEFRSKYLNKTVWVANRESPLDSTAGILSLTANGKLVVSYSGNGYVVWSTNVTAAETNGSIAKLEDNGNLVVREADSGAVLWESFDHPCDTLLPGMKIGINLRTGRSRMLTAWRSDDDPAPGIYAFGIDPQDLNQFFVWRRRIPYSRVIFWNGSSFNTFSYTESVDRSIQNASVVRGHDEVYLTISPSLGQLTWLVIGPSASLTRYSVRPGSAESGDISARISCSRDGGVCGPNSSCNENEEPMCKCLPGYTPISPAEWNSGYWRTGCRPTLVLQCGGEDGYLTLKKAKLPSYDIGYDLGNASTCRERCDDRECSCRAWAVLQNKDGYNDRFQCRMYTGELTGLEEDADDDGGTGSVLSEVNIRVVSSLLSREGRRCGTCGTNVIPYPLSTEPTCGDLAYGSFFCNSLSGLLQFCASDGSSYTISSINPEIRTFVIKPQGIDLCWAGSAQRMDIHLNSSLPFRISNNNTVLLLNCSDATPNEMLHLNCSSSSPCHRYIQEGGAPCFHSKMCCSYTTGGSNTNTSHNIGVLESGCGSYASILNLDPSVDFITDWKEGVQIEWDAPQEPACDSYKDCNGWPNSSCRMQKADVREKRCLCNENFLWDRLSMNCTPGFPTNEFLEFAYGNDNVEVPMVDFTCIAEATENFSDSNKLGRGGFGPVYKGMLSGGLEIAIKKLSRHSGQGIEEFKNEVLLIAKLQHRNLVRIGYMAPEYAADGLFSMKSDVFSFGIILLEIVSGRKNVGFYNDENVLNLTGYAWHLWKEGGGFNLLDPSLRDSSNPTQVLRCIHLALLCVQENAEDRPTMASVLVALESEIVSLPTPGEPAFFRGRCPRAPLRCAPPSQTPTYSNNEITLSTLEGR
ncbi:hypothetical protein ACLOJK_037906 [Asimina triloba]